MSSVLLVVLLVVCVIGALFTTVVALGVGAMCQENKASIKELQSQLNEIHLQLAHAKEFDEAVTDCISGIGVALDVINNRTDWLADVDKQIYNSFGQNKDVKES